jgi:hypothetical protein
LLRKSGLGIPASAAAAPDDNFPSSYLNEPTKLKQEFKDYKGDNGRKAKKTALLNLDLL